MDASHTETDVQTQDDISPRITSWDFEQRAKRYRLAAVFADSQRQAQTFSDLAMLFDKIARDFRNWEEKRDGARPIHLPANLTYLH
jgi:hypothetical protein